MHAPSFAELAAAWQDSSRTAGHWQAEAVHGETVLCTATLEAEYTVLFARGEPHTYAGAARALVALPDGLLLAGELAPEPLRYVEHVVHVGVGEAEFGEGGFVSAAALADGTLVAGGARSVVRLDGLRETWRGAFSRVAAVTAFAGGFAVADVVGATTTALGRGEITVHEGWRARTGFEPGALTALGDGLVVVGHSPLTALRLDGSGSPGWERVVGGEGRARAVAPFGDGVVLAGDSPAGIEVVALDAGGEVIWTRSLSGVARGLHVAADRIRLAGSTGTAPTRAAVWTLDGGGAVLDEWSTP